MGSVESFFSFSPSRTRSRGSSAAARVVFAVLIVAVLDGGAALAAEAAPAPRVRNARADSLPHRSRPFFVMLRSAAVPGWGQVYNNKYWKAGVVVAGEGFLAWNALRELHRENEAIDHQAAVEQAGYGPGDPQYIDAVLNVETHRNRKITWIWWGVAGHLLTMVDAYVDAHLASFEADFGPPQSAVDLGESPRLTLELRTRF